MQTNLKHQEATDSTDTLLRTELEKYITDLELAIRDLDTEIGIVKEENQVLEQRNADYSERVRGMMFKLMLSKSTSRRGGGV